MCSSDLGEGGGSARAQPLLTRGDGAGGNASCGAGCRRGVVTGEAGDACDSATAAEAAAAAAPAASRAREARRSEAACDRSRHHLDRPRPPPASRSARPRSPAAPASAARCVPPAAVAVRAAPAQEDDPLPCAPPGALLPPAPPPAPPQAGAGAPPPRETRSSSGRSTRRDTKPSPSGRRQKQVADSSHVAATHTHDAGGADRAIAAPRKARPGQASPPLTHAPWRDACAGARGTRLLLVRAPASAERQGARRAPASAAGGAGAGELRARRGSAACVRALSLAAAVGDLRAAVVRRRHGAQARVLRCALRAGQPWLHAPLCGD